MSEVPGPKGTCGLDGVPGKDGMAGVPGEDGVPGSRYDVKKRTKSSCTLGAKLATQVFPVTLALMDEMDYLERKAHLVIRANRLTSMQIISSNCGLGCLW